MTTLTHLFFFRKFVTEEHLVRMVANFNRHQKMRIQRCKEFEYTTGAASSPNRSTFRKYATIIDLPELKKFVGLMIAAACCVVRRKRFGNIYVERS